MQEPEIPPFKGESILGYSQREIDMSVSVLGDRWLNRKQWCLVFAPSGVGKSQLAVQLPALWAVGLPALGIDSTADIPRKSLILQSEDDDNDMTEMCRVVDRLNLKPAERTLLAQNTHMAWLNDVSHPRIWTVLQDWMTNHYTGVDLLILNPLASFLGGSIYDDDLVVEFLRRLNAFINHFNCAAIIIHHTPKTGNVDITKLGPYDLQYGSAGPALINNSARCGIRIDAMKTPGIFKFTITKRQDKSGWPTTEKLFSHSRENGVNLWVPASKAETDSACSDGKGPEATLSTLSPIEKITMQELQERGAALKPPVGRHRTRDNVNLLLERERLETEWKKNPAGKGGDIKLYFHSPKEK